MDPGESPDLCGKRDPRSRIHIVPRASHDWESYLSPWQVLPGTSMAKYVCAKFAENLTAFQNQAGLDDSE